MQDRENRKLMNIIRHERNNVVILVREDGYIQLTELASSMGKRLDSWLSNQYAKIVINSFEAYEQEKQQANPDYQRQEILISAKGRYGGTWAHPFLAMAFTMAVKPELFLWMQDNLQKNSQEGVLIEHSFKSENYTTTDLVVTKHNDVQEAFELGQLQAQQENVLQRITTMEETYLQRLAAIEHTQLSTTKMALAAFNNASQTQANAEILRAIHEATNKKSDELRMMERHLHEMTVALAQKSYTPKGHDNNSNEKSTLEEMMEEQLEKAQQVIQELGRRIEELENHKNLIIRGFIQGGCFSIEELCSSSKEELNSLEAVDLERLQCQEYINLLEDYDDLWKEFNEYLARRGQATLEQDEYRPSLGRALKSPKAYIREYMINNERTLA